MSRLPIRLRLTLTFALVMAVVLAATGGFVYVRVGDALLTSVDQTLRSQATEAATHAHDEHGLVDPDASGGTTLAQLLDGSGTVARTTLAGLTPLLSPVDAARVAAGGTVWRSIKLQKPSGSFVMTAFVTLNPRHQISNRIGKPMNGQRFGKDIHCTKFAQFTYKPEVRLLGHHNKTHIPEYFIVHTYPQQLVASYRLHFNVADNYGLVLLPR